MKMPTMQLEAMALTENDVNSCGEINLSPNECPIQFMTMLPSTSKSRIVAFARGKWLV